MDLTSPAPPPPPCVVSFVCPVAVAAVGGLRRPSMYRRGSGRRLRRFQLECLCARAAGLSLRRGTGAVEIGECFRKRVCSRRPRATRIR